jgi:hypothetical protein
MSHSVQVPEHARNNHPGKRAAHWAARQEAIRKAAEDREAARQEALRQKEEAKRLAEEAKRLAEEAKVRLINGLAEDIVSDFRRRLAIHGDVRMATSGAYVYGSHAIFGLTPEEFKAAWTKAKAEFNPPQPAPVHAVENG